MTGPTGFVHLPGGYVPNPPPGVQPQQQQQQVSQQQTQQTQQTQTPIWNQPQGAAPVEGFGPPQFPAPFRTPQPFQGQPQQFQQQPQQQPQIPQHQSQQPAPQQNIDLNTRLTGANIPTELQGRTMAEAMQIYNGMRNVVLQQTAQPPRSAVQQPAPVQQPQGTPQSQQEGWDWRNPQAAIAKVVQEQLAPVVQALQPVVMQSNMQSVQAARNAAAAQIPNFAQIEAQVVERLRGADPQQLMNPEMWRVAAESVVGQLALQGRLPAQPQVTQQQTPRYNQWLQPAQNLQPGQQPVPNMNGFFTEQPNTGAPNAAPQQLTSTQLWAAQQMNMSPDTYAAWAAGVPTGGPR